VRRALLNDEVDANVLMAFDRLAVLGGGEKRLSKNKCIFMKWKFFR